MAVWHEAKIRLPAFVSISRTQKGYAGFPVSLLAHFLRASCDISTERLTETTRAPELLLIFSRSSLQLMLLADPSRGIPAWSFERSFRGVFSEEEITTIMDEAIGEQPGLLEDLKEVCIILLDQPSIMAPEYLVEQDRITEIATRYLRMRQGDQFLTDPVAGGEKACYTFPRQTLSLLREYYGDAGNVHMMSLLHAFITKRTHRHQGFVLYTSVIGNALFMLGYREGRLSFSRQFALRDDSDAVYYLTACRQAFSPDRISVIRIEEAHSAFAIYAKPYMSTDEEITIPTWRELIEEAGICAS